MESTNKLCTIKVPHIPVALIVTIFGDREIEGRLTPLKPQTGAIASLPLSFVTPATSVASVLTSASFFLLQNDTEQRIKEQSLLANVY